MGRSGGPNGLADGVGGVEVAVGEVITHPRDLRPRDIWFAGQQPGGQYLDGVADLQEPNPDYVEDQAV
jgi:hypothetical protein